MGGEKRGVGGEKGGVELNNLGKVIDIRGIIGDLGLLFLVNGMNF